MRRLALVLSVVALSFGGASVAPAADPVSLGPAAAAKPCGSGYKHAIIAGDHKCLKTGQFCARRYDRQYHRYGFHCHRYDAAVERYRLTR